MAITNTPDSPGHELLEAYLQGAHLRNRELAERVRMLRRHPTRPSAAVVSHWRNGRQAPPHDMKIWLELATEGAVPAESWGASEAS